MVDWRQVSGFEGLYEVSTNGRVRNAKTLKDIAVCNLNKNGGYKKVGLWKNNTHHNFLVHRLMAVAFLRNPNGKPTVNHKDGKKNNNVIENLEWSTNSEQWHHAVKMGLRPRSNHMTVVMNIETGEKFSTVKEAAASVGLKRSTLGEQLRGANPHQTALRYQSL